MHTITDKKLLMLRPQEIRSSPHLLRSSSLEEEIETLRQSIAVCGLIEPLPVRKNERGVYELICGERRLEAAKRAKLRRVPCIVHSVDAPTALLYSLSENMQNKGLSFFEEAEALKRLIRHYGMTHTEVAFSLGLTQNRLNSKLKLLKLDLELQSKITEEKLPEEIALLLLKIPPEKRNEALDEIIYNRLDILRARELISDILSPKKDTPPEEKSSEAPQKRKAAVGDIRIFSNSLSKLYESIRSSGVDARLLKRETELYTEYKIRIPKKEEVKSEAQYCLPV